MKNDVEESTLEAMIRQVVEDEIVTFVSSLQDLLVRLMEANEPKEAETLFRESLLGAGAKMFGKAFERMDNEIRKIVRDRGHRDDSGGFCQGLIEGKGRKPIRIQTVLGQMVVNRWTGICRKCGKFIGSVEQILDVTNGMSAAAASAVSLAGVIQPYRPSEDVLQELLGIRIDDNRIRRTVISLASRSEDTMVHAFSEAQGVLPSSDSTVYVTIDGGRIRMSQEHAWREPCCALLLWKDKQENWVKFGLSDPLCKEAVLGPLDEWMQRLRIANPNQDVVIIADGAGWIWNWAEKYPWAIKILDYYHLKEHVCDAAKALYGEDQKQIEKWTDDIIDRLWRGWVPSTIEMLKQMEYEGDLANEKKEAVKDLVTYLVNHPGLIDYARHRNAGRNIGSGSIESFCKQLFTMRMKGPGMFWGAEGAKAVMSLRTLYLTNKWNLLWDRPQQSMDPAA